LHCAMTQTPSSLQPYASDGVSVDHCLTNVYLMFDWHMTMVWISYHFLWLAGTMVSTCNADVLRMPIATCAAVAF
jgi:hypothetical protein